MVRAARRQRAQCSRLPMQPPPHPLSTTVFARPATPPRQSPDRQQARTGQLPANAAALHTLSRTLAKRQAHRRQLPPIPTSATHSLHSPARQQACTGQPPAHPAFATPSLHTLCPRPLSTHSPFTPPTGVQTSPNATRPHERLVPPTHSLMSGAAAAATRLSLCRPANVSAYFASRRPALACTLRQPRRLRASVPLISALQAHALRCAWSLQVTKLDERTQSACCSPLGTPPSLPTTRPTRLHHVAVACSQPRPEFRLRQREAHAARLPVQQAQPCPASAVHKGQRRAGACRRRVGVAPGRSPSAVPGQRFAGH